MKKNKSHSDEESKVLRTDAGKQFDDYQEWSKLEPQRMKEQHEKYVREEKFIDDFWQNCKVSKNADCLKEFLQIVKNNVDNVTYYGLNGKEFKANYKNILKTVIKLLLSASGGKIEETGKCPTLAEWLEDGNYFEDITFYGSDMKDSNDRKYVCYKLNSKGEELTEAVRQCAFMSTTIQTL